SDLLPARHAERPRAGLFFVLTRTQGTGARAATRFDCRKCQKLEGGYGSRSRNPPEYWSGRPDSNRRRPAWEAGILPLNYGRSLGVGQVLRLLARESASCGRGGAAAASSLQRLLIWWKSASRFFSSISFCAASASPWRSGFEYVPSWLPVRKGGLYTGSASMVGVPQPINHTGPPLCL